MAEKNTILSQNIKYLRKSQKLSQEEFAQKLGIKRSNIAAYESKNVEPRLRVILEIAKFFNVSVSSLIETNIEQTSKVISFNSEKFASPVGDQTLDIQDNVDINEFIEKSMRIKKVLEGFKSFYAFKKNAMINLTPDKEKLIFDIDNFIQLIEHLLGYNETVIKAISTKTNAMDASGGQ